MITKSFIKQKRFNSFFKFIQTLNHSNFMRKSVPYVWCCCLKRPISKCLQHLLKVIP